MNINITAPMFHDEAKALAHLEGSRWPDGVNCPHCGSLRVRKMEGKTQAGMFLCNDCRDKFTMRTGSVMERSHVPLHKWLLATHIMAASKKGMSALQMSRMIGVTYKTAWFLCHRTSPQRNLRKQVGQMAASDQRQYSKSPLAFRGAPTEEQMIRVRGLSDLAVRPYHAQALWGPMQNLALDCRLARAAICLAPANPPVRSTTSTPRPR